MSPSIPKALPVWFGAALLVTGGALLGCSSRAAENRAAMPKAEARMVYYAMPG